MLSPASSTDPIFIIGIRSRSGTNYLSDLLRLHPDCGDVPSPIWEDHLLHHVDLMARYARSTYNRWHRWVIKQGVEEKLEDNLFECIGHGLITFLSSRVRAKRLLTKTPGVRNLEYFFKFFPHAYLLILVRDGRAVVESAVKTSKRKPSSLQYELAMRSWTRGAKTILRFDEATKNSDCKYLIVRYEDLWGDVDGELHRIFDFLGLDAAKYNFNAASNLPVRGSSVLRGSENEHVHWKPVEKSAEFDPMLRWSRWSRALHERFNWIAGRYPAQFGYEAKEYTGKRSLWAIWNLVLDIIWPIRFLIRSLSQLNTWKRCVKWCVGEERVLRIRSILLAPRS